MIKEQAKLDDLLERLTNIRDNLEGGLEPAGVWEAPSSQQDRLLIGHIDAVITAFRALAVETP